MKEVHCKRILVTAKFASMNITFDADGTRLASLESLIGCCDVPCLPAGDILEL